MRYNNYHKHDHAGNPWIDDTIAKEEDYCKRAVELGHTSVFTTNHGVQGRIFEYLEQSKKYGLKMIYGTEGYYVPDRFEKDKSNKHIIMIAKNNSGVEQINEIMSVAHSEEGFYGRPRIDNELLWRLDPKDIIITTACVAGIWDNTELIISLYNRFKDNFFLELQNHNIPKQKEVNQRMLTLHDELGIKIIHANDSHYIYPEDEKWRDIYLKAKWGDKKKKESDFEYEGEMVLDYPDSDVIFDRYKLQGICTESQVEESLYNTLVFDDCEPITIINDEIKLPSVSDTPMDDLRKIVHENWEKEKRNISVEKHKEYEDAIEYELGIVDETKMANYFLIDYNIVKRAQEVYDGRLTNTGRGCFAGECLVHTNNGLIPLMDVSVGDKVIAKDGRFHSVLKTMKYDIEEETVEIKHLYGSVKNHKLICTKDHKIFVNRNGNNEWIEAQNVSSNDFVVVPKIKFENKANDVIDLNDYNIFGFRFDDDYIYEEYDRGNSRYNKKVRRFIPNDAVHNRFIGLMYGDGAASCNKRSSISIALNSKNHKNAINRQTFEWIANRLELKITENKSKNKDLIQLYINSKVFTNYVKTEMFESKKGCDKQFNDKFFYQSKENLSALLDGLHLSDGSSKERNGRISFDNTSRSIINAYKLISLATGNGVYSLAIRNGGIDLRGYNRKESYKLRYNPNSENARKICERTFEDDDFYYLPVKEVVLKEKSKLSVYDLEVDGDHSYLINNMIVHNSAPSFYITKMLGLTDIDRLVSPITLFPTRFMSIERILSTRSLPDIDLNTTDRVPFIKATEDLLGKENCAWMLSWKPLQDASAFRLYCRGIDLPISEYDEVAKNLDEYREDKKWKKYIEDSKRYVGVIESVSESPCSICLYYKPLNRELGLVRTPGGTICCLLDGYNCDKYKYLKND